VILKGWTNLVTSLGCILGACLTEFH